MYLLSFFKKGDTIQGGTLFKGGHYLRKYGSCHKLFDGTAVCINTKESWSMTMDSKFCDLQSKGHWPSIIIGTLAILI